MAIERTLFILKPDAFQRHCETSILIRITEAEVQLKIIRGKLVPRATQEQLNNHFPAAKQWVIDMGNRARSRIQNEKGLDPTEYFGVSTDYETGMKIVQGCHEYYLSGPLWVLILEGFDAVAFVRKLVGKTLPSQAEKGTIRGDLGKHESMHELRRGAARNLVHASDSVEEARREIAAWFTPAEIEKFNLLVT